MTLKKSVPSALELRDLLEEMAVRELRGPVQGEDEEVPGRIRDRYLVGILAPRQRAEGEALPLFDRPAAPLVDDDDNLEGDLPPGDDMAVEGAGRGNLGGDDGADRADPLDVQGGVPLVAGPVLLRPPRRQGPQGHAPLGPLRQGPQRLPDQPQDRDAQAGLETPALRHLPRDPAPGRAGRPAHRRRGVPRRQGQGADPPPCRPLERHPLPGQRGGRAAAPQPGADLDVPVRTGGRGPRRLPDLPQAVHPDRPDRHRRSLQARGRDAGDGLSPPRRVRRRPRDGHPRRPRPDRPQSVPQDHDQGDPQLRGPQDHPADRRGRRTEPRLRQARRARPGHEAPARDAPGPAYDPGWSRWSSPTGSGSGWRGRRSTTPPRTSTISRRWRGRPSSGARRR